MKKTFVTRILVVAALSIGVATMSGCATMNTAIEKRDLTVESKMSDTIFLEPVAADQKTVFLDIRNTTDQDIDIAGMKSRMANVLKIKGYSLVANPEDATFLIQENILSAGKVNKETPYAAMQSGFGGAAAGSVAGVALSGTGYSNYGRNAAIGSLIGAGIGLAANALVKDVYYNIVTDIRIRQKVGGNIVEHKTRTVTVANKMNLDFVEAKPALEDGLVKTTTGIL